MGKISTSRISQVHAQELLQCLDRGKVKILDVGCGTGAATWYIAREGFDAYGVDVSETAISKAKERFVMEGLKGDFKVQDMIDLQYPDGFFDYVIGHAAMQHNKEDELRIILEEIHGVLKTGGKFFSIMLNDKTKFKDEKDNPYASRGYYHLLSEQAIRDLFFGFSELELDLSQSDNGHFFSHYIINVRK